ncbi:MAG TPA: DUF1656 domain-containing protein [Verrucomicrobiae bacterium]|jgi:predicted PurR-regulated permease PerM
MKEIDFCGIYFPPFFLSLLLAGALYFLLHRALDRIAVQKWVWNRSVFEAALFVILLALITFIL